MLRFQPILSYNYQGLIDYITNVCSEIVINPRNSAYSKVVH